MEEFCPSFKCPCVVEDCGVRAVFLAEVPGCAENVGLAGWIHLSPSFLLSTIHFPVTEPRPLPQSIDSIIADTDILTSHTATEKYGMRLQMCVKFQTWVLTGHVFNDNLDRGPFDFMEYFFPSNNSIGFWNAPKSDAPHSGLRFGGRLDLMFDYGFVTFSPDDTVMRSFCMKARNHNKLFVQKYKDYSADTWKQIIDKHDNLNIEEKKEMVAKKKRKLALLEELRRAVHQIVIQGDESNSESGFRLTESDETGFTATIWYY